MLENKQIPVENPLRAWFRLNRPVRHIDAAKDLDVSEGTVARWCAGTRRPDDATREKIRLYTKGMVRPEDWTAYYLELDRERAA
jgi:hypothetical protein